MRFPKAAALAAAVLSVFALVAVQAPGASAVPAAVVAKKKPKKAAVPVPVTVSGTGPQEVVLKKPLAFDSIAQVTSSVSEDMVNFFVRNGSADGAVESALNSEFVNEFQGQAYVPGNASSPVTALTVEGSPDFTWSVTFTPVSRVAVAGPSGSAAHSVVLRLSAPLAADTPFQVSYRGWTRLRVAAIKADGYQEPLVWGEDADYGDADYSLVLPAGTAFVYLQAPDDSTLPENVVTWSF